MLILSLAIKILLKLILFIFDILLKHYILNLFNEWNHYLYIDNSYLDLLNNLQNTELIKNVSNI